MVAGSGLSDYRVPSHSCFYKLGLLLVGVLLMRGVRLGVKAI